MTFPGLNRKATLPLLALLFFTLVIPTRAAESCGENPSARIRVDAGHPWRPPFGLDRVGKPLAVGAEITSASLPVREYSLVGFLEGKEIGRYALALSRGKSIWTGEASFDIYPDQIVLSAKGRFQGDPEEVAREAVELPAFEAEAIARPEQIQIEFVKAGR